MTETSDSKSDSNVVDRLTQVLEQRRQADPESSYVASLYASGLNHILQKVGEEAVETILAAKEGDRDQVIRETADLWFHTLVMLSQLDLTPSDIFAELERRFGTSGIEEKAARQNKTGG